MLHENLSFPMSVGAWFLCVGGIPRIGTQHAYICLSRHGAFLCCSEKELRGVTEKDDVRCNGASVVGVCCAVPIVSRARIAVDFLGYNTAHTSSRAPQ